MVDTSNFTFKDLMDFIDHTAKWIDGPISWDNEEGGVAVFEQPIQHDGKGFAVHVRGSINVFAEKLTYQIEIPSVGPVYRLCLDRPHTNPDGSVVGPVHKHRYRTQHEMKKAYTPKDITEPWSHPDRVWREFCDEANIIHNGALEKPPMGGQLRLVR